MKNTVKIALSGLLCAVALSLMLITTIFPFGTYALPCFAGMLMVIIVIECGAKWAYTAYSVVGLLSLLLVSDKEAAIYFVAFFGFYPIIKSSLERLKSARFQYVLKFAIFNVCVILAFFVAKTILMIPNEEFTIFGFYVPWVFLIIGNIMFVFYDKCVTIEVQTYLFKFRNKLFKHK